MKIPFEQLDLRVRDIAIAGLSGHFEVDDAGEIQSITLEEWAAADWRNPKTTTIDGTTQDGLSRFFWFLLRPALRQHCAEQIMEAVAFYRPRRAADPDAEHRMMVREFV